MTRQVGVETSRLPHRRVEQVHLAFDVALVEGQPAIVAVDAADGAFVRLHDLPALPDPDPSLCGLSADGRQILLRAARDSSVTAADLRLVNLPTGQQKTFALPFDTPRYYVAGLSPDGTHIAVLSDDDHPVGYEGSRDNRAHVHIVDVNSGTWTRLWTSPDEAWASWECGIDWSPDGKRLAVTHMFFDHEDSHDDWNAIVILDAASGTAVHRVDFHEPIGWLDNDTLITMSPEPGMGYTVLDLNTDTTRTVEIPWAPGASAGGAIAATNDRIVGSWGYNEPPHNTFFHTDAFGQGLRILFTTDTRQPRMFLAAQTRPLDSLDTPQAPHA